MGKGAYYSSFSMRFGPTLLFMLKMQHDISDVKSISWPWMTAN